jgi:hypothetical protein
MPSPQIRVLFPGDADAPPKVRGRMCVTFPSKAMGQYATAMIKMRQQYRIEKEEENQRIPTNGRANILIEGARLKLNYEIDKLYAIQDSNIE